MPLSSVPATSSTRSLARTRPPANTCEREATATSAPVPRASTAPRRRMSPSDCSRTSAWPVAAAPLQVTTPETSDLPVVSATMRLAAVISKPTPLLATPDCSSTRPVAVSSPPAPVVRSPSTMSRRACRSMLAPWPTNGAVALVMDTRSVPARSAPARRSVSACSTTLLLSARL